MKLKHFFNLAQLKKNDRIGLERMIQDCDFMHVKDIEEVVDPIEQSSVICLYDEFGEMCAFASVTDFDTYLQVEKLYVDYNSRRKGFGKALLDQAIKFSKEKGYDMTFLVVAADNINAQKFYESQKLLIDRIPRGGNVISMKRFNSNFVHGVGEIIYHLSKNLTIEEIEEKLQREEGIEELKKNFDDFYKTREKDKEKLEKRLNSKLIKNTLKLLKGEEFAEKYSDEDFKRAKLCQECFKSIKNHELEKNNEKTIK